MIKRFKRMKISTRNTLIVAVFSLIASLISGYFVYQTSINVTDIKRGVDALEIQAREQQNQTAIMQRDLDLAEEHIRLVNESLYKHARMSVELIPNSIIEASITITVDKENVTIKPKASPPPDFAVGFVGYTQNFTWVIKNVGTETIFLRELQIHISNDTYLKTNRIIINRILEPDKADVRSFLLSIVTLRPGLYKMEALAIGDRGSASDVLDLVIDEFPQ